MLREHVTGRANEQVRLTPADAADLEGNREIFQEVASYQFRDLNLARSGEVDTATGFLVTPNLFHLLGVGQSMDALSPLPSRAEIAAEAKFHSGYCFGFTELVLSMAARNPCASLTASSFAQKCMKNRRGSSVNMWLCTAVT